MLPVFCFSLPYVQCSLQGVSESLLFLHDSSLCQALLLHNLPDACSLHGSQDTAENPESVLSTNQNSHMLSTHIYAKCTILIDLSLKLNFHVHGFHCILEEIFYCFDCLRLNFYKFCLFLNFLFYFFSTAFSKAAF